jgi:hypothetical protein
MRLLTGAAILAVALGTANAQSNDLAPTGKGIGTVHSAGARSTTVGGPRIDTPDLGQHGIYYHGGPVMTATKNLYFIWYGNWSGDTAQSILDDWANNLGGSPYFNMNSTYQQGKFFGPKVSNSVALAADLFDNYSHGTSLSDSAIQAIVAAQNPTDTNGLYFVLTSSDVNETSGFCTAYCGWHTHGIINGKDIKYSFVGNPARCPTDCVTPEMRSLSPNNNVGADGMANIMAHELSEAATDPDLNAWYDNSGAENGDKCAWQFGTEFAAPNGAKANVTLGTKDYLLQEIWVNAQSGFCALSH